MHLRLVDFQQHLTTVRLYDAEIETKSLIHIRFSPHVQKNTQENEQSIDNRASFDNLNVNLLAQKTFIASKEVRFCISFERIKEAYYFINKYILNLILMLFGFHFFTDNGESLYKSS